MNLDAELFNKYKRLLSILQEFDSPLLALSGGIDSSFLAFALKDSGLKGTIATVTSLLFTEKEGQRAKDLANEFGFSFYLIDIGREHLNLIKTNPVDRCYICKKKLFSDIITIMENTACDVVMDGTNFDDRLRYRPGMKALAELGVVSPLSEAQITKEEIRALSRYFHLRFADRPSSPCMATRFPYGETLTEEKIKRVEASEAFLSGLGFRRFRVRSHNSLARLEIDFSEIHALFDPLLMQTVREKLDHLGFEHVTLDMAGFSSGSMDKGVMKL
jgi:uncharacterized protein